MTAKRKWHGVSAGSVLTVARELTAVLALIALVVAIIGINEQTANRRASARDSCQLLRGLVLSATTTAPKQRAATLAYIRRTPLSNCATYANRIVR